MLYIIYIKLKLKKLIKINFEIIIFLYKILNYLQGLEIYAGIY